VSISLGEKTLEGKRLKRATCPGWSKPPTDGDGLSRGAKPWRWVLFSQAWWSRVLAREGGLRVDFPLPPLKDPRWREHDQRQEGSGAGDGERLRERSKALKGESRKWIRYEIRPADTRADESVKRLRKPEDAGGRARQALPTKPLLGMGKRYGEQNLAGGSRQCNAAFRGLYHTDDCSMLGCLWRRH